jgi:hypothetical protein
MRAGWNGTRLSHIGEAGPVVGRGGSLRCVAHRARSAPPATPRALFAMPGNARAEAWCQTPSCPTMSSAQIPSPMRPGLNRGGAPTKMNARKSLPDGRSRARRTGAVGHRALYGYHHGPDHPPDGRLTLKPPVFVDDAGGETRTPKGSRPPAPKAGVSTDSTTPASRPQATRNAPAHARAGDSTSESAAPSGGAYAVSCTCDVDLRSACT